MRHILDGFGARIYKTYRIFGKALTSDAAASGPAGDAADSLTL
jgi:hypothetical protein